MGGGGAVTVAQQKIIKRYGSQEGYRQYQAQKKIEKDVKDEIERLGLNSVSSAEDYAQKYSQASAATKKYIDTPTQFKAYIAEQTSTLIAENKAKINEKVKYLQGRIATEKARLAEKIASAYARNRKDLIDTYEDSSDKKIAGFEGEIEGFKKGIGQAVEFKDIRTYASDYGSYKAQRIDYQRKAKAAEPKMTVEYGTIKPGTSDSSTMKSIDTAPKISQPLYAPLESITGYQGGEATAYTSADMKKKVTIQPTVAHVGYIKNIPDRPEMTIKSELIEPRIIGMRDFKTPVQDTKESMYTKIDRSIGGVLPGGVPYKEERKQYYNNIPYVETRTRAVEVGTGKIAAEQGKDASGNWKMNTRNANLEDHYFIKLADGTWKDMGVYKKELDNASSNRNGLFSMGTNIKIDLDKPGHDYGQGTSIYTQKKIENVKPTGQGEFIPGLTYLGGKEIRTSIQPQFGTIIESGFSNIGRGERIDISQTDITADYSTSIKKRIGEFIPVAGTPLTQLDEEAYLPTAADIKKLKNLIEKKTPGAAREIRIFLRDQQAILKRDIGRYNQLSVKDSSEEGLTQKEYNESEALRKRINKGQSGTIGDIVYESTEDATKRGESINLLGVDVSPRTARRGLIAGGKAYNVLSDILVYQGGAAIAAPVLGATAAGSAILGAAAKGGKVLKYAITPLGLGYGGAVGFGEYQKREDIGDAVAAGVGGAGGFFAGVYSKQIVEGAGKALKKVGDITDLKEVAKLKPMGKKAQVSMYDQQSAYEKAKAVAKQKGISIEDVLKKMDLEKALRHAKKKDVLSFIKKQLTFIKNNPNLSSAEKSIRAKNLYEAIANIRPDIVYTQPQSIPDVKPEQFTMFGAQQAPSVTAKSTQTFDETTTAISAFAGLGAYERTDQVKVSQLTAPAQTSGLLYDTLQATDTLQDTGQDQIIDIFQSPAQKPAQDTIQQPAQTIVQQPAQTIVQQPATQTQIPGFGETIRPRPLPRGGDPGMGVIIDIDFGGGRRYTESVQPYAGQVLVKGKYKTVTTKPHTKKGALDKVAKIVDNTIAAQGKVVPIGKKKIAKSKAISGDGYYNQNQKKFRGFKMYKGARVPVRDTIIEKKNRRLDTRGEQTGMTVAQFSARTLKRAAGLPVRKKNSKKKRKLTFRI